jgi:uncharacterized repeat protein (TIGR01451 family)
MKKLACIITIIALLIIGIPVLANSTPDPTTVTIVGDFQDEIGCPGDWQPDCAVTYLTYDGDDDVWQGTFSIPAGNWQYKAALNNSWVENYGAYATPDGANINLILSDPSNIKFYYDHKSHWVTDSANSVIATVAGSFQDEIGCPGDWQADCLRSWLQDPDGDGIYVFVTDQIPGGDYEAKVTHNESWDEYYGADGVPNGTFISFSVTDGDIVIFQYDPITHILNINTPPSSVTIAGNLQSELGGSNWNPSDTTTHLTYSGDDDVWQGTFYIPTGSWEYLAALNDSWLETYGANAILNGTNISLSLSDSTDVKFYYDHKSHWVTDSINSVIATVAGSFQDEIGCPGDWQADCLRSWLQDPDGDGIYVFVTDQIPAGNYEAKVAHNESWDENYGAGGVPDGPNIPFSVTEGDIVLFQYYPMTHVLTINILSYNMEVSINEIRIDQPGTDIDEYFELAGSVGTPLDGLTYLVIGDGPGGSGTIEAVVDLSGQSIPASGFFVAAENTYTLGTADLTTNLNFENDDNVTHLLVAGFTGSDGQDLDTDDDGTLDIEPWMAIIDSVALIHTFGGDLVYSENSYWYSFLDINFPAHVYLCGLYFENGAYDPAAGMDTPGAPNICLFISEIRTDQPSTDYDEYFELVGNPGTPLAGFTYLVIGDGTGGSGTIEAVVDLSGQSIPASGFFVAAENTFTLGTADLTTNLNFENDDNVTHLLVAGFTGSDGQDLDTDDDGTLDIEPWLAIIDAIALIETVGSGDLVYSHHEIGPDGIYAPGHIYFCFPSWKIGAFDPAVGLDTPGVPNICDLTVTINEIRTDQPSNDNDEYFELAGSAGTPLTGFTYLVIGDGTGGSGTIEAVVDLSGQSIPASGFFVAAENTFTLGTADLTTDLNFENDDNITHLLVFGFTGGDDQDLDTDDDGTLDIEPWLAIIDSVALIQTVGSGELVYSTTVVGPDGIYAPGHIYLCSSGWKIGDFDPVTGLDTPGELNICDLTGTLTVFKNIINDNGGAEEADDFTIYINDSDSGALLASFPGNESGTTVELEAGTSYSVSESGPSGYDATFSGDFVGTIEAGIDKICIIINDDNSPVINEFVCNHISTDIREFIEIFGPPDTDYSHISIIQIEGDGAGAGVIDTIFPVGTTDSEGFWTTGFQNNQLENGTITLLLVEAFTGSLEDDLDSDDDGILDVQPWSMVLDSVAVSDGGSADIVYSAVVLTPGYDGISFTLGGASRIPNGYDTDSTSDWVRNDFELYGLPGYTGTPEAGEAINTPGAENLLVDDVMIEIDKQLGTSDTGPWFNSVEVLVDTNIYYRFVVANAGNMPLQNIEVTDPVLGEILYGDALHVFCTVNQLEVSGTAECGPFGPVSAMSGLFTNEGSAEGIYDSDGDGLGYSTADSDQASYFGADPSIEIAKTTSDNYGNEGDSIGVIPGDTVTWKYYITNTGNVPLENVTVTDDQGVTVTCSQDILAVGESMTCTASGTTAAGWYDNEGTASGDYTDDVGNSITVTDYDVSSYYGLDGGYITSSSLCEFGETFKLIFTPDIQNDPGYYRLSASNPGQFYYNLFYIVEAGGSIDVDIPYPFVTRGAMPVHVYGGVFIQDGGNDEVCFTPTNEIAAFGSTLTIDDYSGDFYTITIEGLPEGEFVYVNIHLDYGLKKTYGWQKGNDDALADENAYPDILDGTTYTFNSPDITGSEDSIENINTFKRIKGFGGMVVDSDGDGVAGEQIQLLGPDGSLIETMTTDENGWFWSEYVHKGKTADYKLVWNGEEVQVTVGGKVKFGGAYFTTTP